MSENVCRVCLSPELLLINIFKKRENTMISTNLMLVAKVYITPEDGLPQTICTKCIQKLEDCLEFIKLCETSDKILRSSIINKIEMKITLNDGTSYINNGDNDSDSLSRSENERELLIDESVDCTQLFPDEKFDKSSKLSETHTTQINVKNTKKKSRKKQQCFTCGKIMSSRYRLKTHMVIHTGERPYACHHCKRTFSLEQNLKVHLRIHTGEKPLQCAVCGESFAHSAGLAAHKRKHTGQTPYTCGLCPRSFRTFGHLQYHLRQHTGEKRFECDTCGRAFITKACLKQHFLTHSGDRPHVCYVCGLRMTLASHLKRHMRLIHNNTENKSLSCEKCQLKFTRKLDLEKHLKNHDHKNT